MARFVTKDCGPTIDPFVSREKILYVIIFLHRQMPAEICCEGESWLMPCVIMNNINFVSTLEWGQLLFKMVNVHTEMRQSASCSVFSVFSALVRSLKNVSAGVCVCLHFKSLQNHVTFRFLFAGKDWNIHFSFVVDTISSLMCHPRFKRASLGD